MSVNPAEAVVRSVNVSKFDIDTIEAVEANDTLTTEAGAVVALVSLVGGLRYAFSGNISAFIGFVIVGLLGWALWAWLSATIAQKVVGIETTDTGEMLRVTGYAYAPQLLGVFNFISPIFGIIGGFWSLAAVILGMRQAGDTTLMKAVVIAMIGFVPWLIGMALVARIF